MIQVGASIIDITPPSGIAMAGFAARTAVAEGQSTAWAPSLQKARGGSARTCEPVRHRAELARPGVQPLDGMTTPHAQDLELLAGVEQHVPA